MKISALVIALGASVLTSVPSVVIGQETNAIQSRDFDEEMLDIPETQDRRGLFSFWGVVLMMIHPNECPDYFTEEEFAACKSCVHKCPPIAKPHHDCVSECIYGISADGSDTSTSVNAADASYVNYEDVTGRDTATSGVATSSRSFSWLMLAVAGAAATAAMVAAIIGQRRERSDRHPMAGVIRRRVNQFSCFADSAVCASTDRPERVVEMTMSNEDMDYKLQSGQTVV